MPPNRNLRYPEDLQKKRNDLEHRPALLGGPQNQFIHIVVQDRHEEE